MATGFPIIFQSPLWTPALIAPAVWLDAADASTITLNGTTVSQWNDKSGNLRNASQSTAASQPTYTQSGIGSKPSLTFDGGDFLTGTWAAANEPQATLAMVGNHASDQNIQVSVSIGQTSTNNGFGIGWNGSGVYFASFLWGKSEARRNGFTSDPVIQIGALSNTNIVQSFNGTEDSVAVTSPGSVTTSYQVGAISGTFPVSANTRIAEVVILKSVITIFDRQKLEGYFAWKWGLVGNLPSTHPYKNSPPRQ